MPRMSEVNASPESRGIHPLLRSALRPAAVTILRSLSLATDKIAPNISYPVSRPTATEVVANYSRGLVLLGHSSSRLAPFVWNSFPMRSIITKETANIPKSVRRHTRNTELKVRFNEDFEEIIHECSYGRSGWLTPELISIYMDVHKLGFTATVGTYRDDRLVGGLWGVAIGRVVSAYSLFHKEDNAGSIAFAALTEIVASDGRWSVIDCGTATPSTARYGATEVPRDKFCELLWEGLRDPSSAEIAEERK
jgi:leucyl/phenylalanyl-tRNA--protein transferase